MALDFAGPVTPAQQPAASPPSGGLDLAGPVQETPLAKGRNFVKNMEKGAGKIAIGADKAAGAIGGAVGNVFTGAQRAVAGVRNYSDQIHPDKPSDWSVGALPEYVEHPDNIVKGIQRGAQWAMDPKKQAQTDSIDRKAAEELGMPTRAQIFKFEQGNKLLGQTGATNVLNGAADAVSQIAADPMTIVGGEVTGAIGKGAKALAAVPKIAAAGTKIAASPVGKAVGKVYNFGDAALNPEHHLNGLTEEGKAQVAKGLNVPAQQAQAFKDAETRSIAAQAKTIGTNGVSPDIQEAFKRYGVDAPKTANPKELITALDSARGKWVNAQQRTYLRAQGLLKDGTTGGPTGEILRGIRGHDQFFKDNSAAAVEAAQEGVAKHIAPTFTESNDIAGASAKVNDLRKKAFLADPIPHMGNEAVLTYNRHGAGAVSRGYDYGQQIARGDISPGLQKTLDSMERNGANPKFTDILPNKAGGQVVNAIQNKTLNASQTGLAASIFEKASKDGMTEAQAAREVMRTLGHDRPNQLVQGLEALPFQNFPKFHVQTAIGSGAHALAHNPNRLTNLYHLRHNQAQPQGPVYHDSTPASAFENFVSDPMKYGKSPGTLGGIAEIFNKYNPVNQFEKSPAESTAAMAAGFIPFGEQAHAAGEMFTGQKGEAGENGLQDLLSSIVGGYYTKR